MLLVLLAVASVASSAPAVEWSAPPGCPTDAQVLDQAARIMGRGTIDIPGEVSIRGTIHAEPVGFALAIDIETPTGLTHKRAAAESCALLGSVAALMVAVAVDPIRAVATHRSRPVVAERLDPPLPRPATSEPSAPRLVAVRTADRSPPARREEPPWVEGRLRASGGVGHSIVPRLDGQLALGAGLRTRGLRAEFVAFHVLARRARYPELPSVGADVAAWGGSLRAGPAFDLGPIELSATAGVSVAAMVAAGFGVLAPGRSTSAWIALCFVPGLRWRLLPWLAVGADVEGEMALRRPAFALDALSAVHRAAPIGVRSALVLEIRLGPRSR